MTTETDPPVTEPESEPAPPEPEVVLPDEPYPTLSTGKLSDQAPTVNQTIVLCMREIGAVAKTRQNVTQKYNFRGIDDFLNACHHVMAKHGLTIVPVDMQHELTARDRITDNGKPGYTMHVVNKVRWEAEGPAGDKKHFVTVGEAADTADKATNKSISAAEKYMLISVFKIPTADIAEGDGDHPPMGGSDRPPVQKGTPTSSTGTGAKPTEKQMAAMGALANEVIGQEAKVIKAVMLAITGRVSSRTQMSRKEASDVIDTLKAIQRGEKAWAMDANGATAFIHAPGEEPFETGKGEPEAAPSGD